MSEKEKGRKERRKNSLSHTHTGKEYCIAVSVYVGGKAARGKEKRGRKRKKRDKIGTKS